MPDNIASTYVTSDTGVDFSQVSSDTNGKGVYLLASTKNETNPIYYYRGAVENNNVRFAGFCWKIVRTTEKGGIKLVHNGTPGSSTYEKTHANINESAIKTTIDNWYSTNMTSYTEKLEDTVWCNDKSVFAGGAFGKEATAYNVYNRLYNNKTPSLECAQDNDKFTVSTENGNGALTYPVALLTADEIAYAGGVVHKSNQTFYLYSENLYISWTLSPWSFVNDEEYSGNISAHMFRYSMSRGLSDTTTSSLIYILPAIALAPGTECVEGDGTATNPYVIGD